MDSLLAILFHRAAATLYLFYVIWGFIALSGFGVMPITEGAGALIGRVVFPFIVIVSAGLAALGATFWPNLARMELFAGSAFCMSLVIYLYFVVTRAIGGEGSWSGFVVLLSILVIPAARTVVVIVLLFRQAHPEQQLGA